jgi:hypothetical protein
LRDVVGFGVEFGQGVGEERFGWGDALQPPRFSIDKEERVLGNPYLAGKVGHFRYLESTYRSV